jgi:hypothetical protein
MRSTTYLICHRDGRRDEYVDLDPELKGLKPTPIASRTTTTGTPEPRRVITASTSPCLTENAAMPSVSNVCLSHASSLRLDRERTTVLRRDGRGATH